MIPSSITFHRTDDPTEEAAECALDDESILRLRNGAWVVRGARAFTLDASGTAVVEVRGTGADLVLAATDAAWVQAKGFGNVTVDASRSAVVFIHDSAEVRVSASGLARVTAVDVDCIRPAVTGSAKVRGVLNRHNPCRSQTRS